MLALLAGMRVVVLTDIARFRLEAISFFLFVLLICALVVKWLWNYLRRDFVRLPYLTYGKSIGLVVLWGLLFVIVLAMISGARELMTPGAWEKKSNGGYKLNGAEVEALSVEPERKARMAKLQEALWAYANAHNGAFPGDEFEPTIPRELWKPAEQSGSRYVYLPGRTLGAPARPLAYEPGTALGPRTVLLTDGQIRVMRLDQIQEMMIEEK